MLAENTSSSDTPSAPESRREMKMLHEWSERELSSSDSSDSDHGQELRIPRSSFLKCTRCLRTFREELMKDHCKEFHPQVECSFCHQSVDRFVLRKHQEKDCPERLRFCPRCYVQMAHSQLENHLKTCSLKQLDEPKEKVTPIKGLSFRGTVFEQHTRIAKSFINIARGHRDEKPPYEKVVKAEKEKCSVPSVDDLVKVFCPSTYLDAGDRQLTSVDDDNLIETEISKPLKAALCRREEEKARNNEKIKGTMKMVPDVHASLPPKENKNSQYARIRPPRRALHLRETHRSLGNLLREESCNRKFVKSWLQGYFLDKEKRQELEIRNKEFLEDTIIDEAIELEMKKDSVAKISPGKWPYFVNEIKRRRSKWKDLGFNPEDCSSDEESRESSKHLQQLYSGPENGQVQLNSEIESRSRGSSYWKLMGKSLEEKKNKKSSTRGDSSTVSVTNSSLATTNKEGGTSVGGFYRFCEYCFQLFHEDHLSEHMAACKIRKEAALKKRQRIKDVWKPKRSISLQDKFISGTSSPLLNIPRPFAAEETYSSLALSVAPHMKYHRSGKNKYAFFTKQGRS